MATMIEAIKETLLSELQTALSAFYQAAPSTDKLEYIYYRGDDGTPPAMLGHWYCAIHQPTSRNSTQLPGQPYIQEIWSCRLTFTVRSSYAPNSRIQDPLTLMNQLLRASSIRLISRPWEILTLINTAFNATNATTNGLTAPFKVNDPVPERQHRDPAWMKAISAKKTSHVESISATINLTDALQIQYISGAA